MPPNFNPMEQSSLMNLLAAMRGGLPGTQGYGILQDILAQQQQRVQERQANLSGLIDMLSQNAMAGMPMEANQALLTAQTGGRVPPKAESAMDALYATAPGQAAQGVVDSMMTGLGNIAGQAMAPLLPGPAPVPNDYQNAPIQSVAYQPDPMAEIQQQQALVDLQNSMQPEAAPAPSETDMLGYVIAGFRNGLTQGKDPEELMKEALADPAISGIVSMHLQEIKAAVPELSNLIRYGSVTHDYTYHPPTPTTGANP